MDVKLKPWIIDGEKDLSDEAIKGLEFSGPIYHVEVFDKIEDQTYWPLLHFGMGTALKEAFCSCERAEKGCRHLAAAYLQITRTFDHQPLHNHFFQSLFYQLFHKVAYDSGYDPSPIIFNSPNSAIIEGENSLSFQFYDQGLWDRFRKIIQDRPFQTPENSILFSNLSQQELSWWKQGRPSVALKFALSLYSDLAKFIFIENLKRPFLVTFEEENNLPKIVVFSRTDFSFSCRLSLPCLAELIPYFDSLNTPIKIYKQRLGDIAGMQFDVHTGCMHLSHLQPLDLFHLEGQEIGDWVYVKDKGFFSKEGSSFFDRGTLDETDVAQALDLYPDLIAKFIPVHHHASTLHYDLSMSDQGVLRLQTYIDKPGDLKQSRLVGSCWVYRQDRGFMRLKEPLSSLSDQIIPPEKVSEFVNTHRVWLSDKKGFEAHLAGVESQVSYQVADKLSFFTPVQRAENEGLTLDFGEWIYRKNEGFFSRRQGRILSIVRPGLNVNRTQVSSFIKINREELENVPHFFCLKTPFIKRGINLQVNAAEQLVVQPVCEMIEEFKGLEPQFFGDFAYIPGQGFFELPLGFKLPIGYEKPQVIEASDVHAFIQKDIPKIEKHLLDCDPRLRIPRSMNLQLNYLAKNAKGGLRVDLRLKTEFGEIQAAELVRAYNEKKYILFTNAGLLDLREDAFFWLKQLRASQSERQQALDISTLDFLRLDATYHLATESSHAATAAVTQKILKELREFQISDTPNLTGLCCQLRGYQLTGLHWLWFLYKNQLSGLLCDDMGLGKTHQAMALLAAIHNQIPGMFLVVCPTSVIYHWQDKLEKFLPHLKVHTFHGLKREKPELQPGSILLTSYGVLRLEREVLSSISFDLAIFDEMQVAKNPNSLVHESLKALRSNMKIGLSGTPIENNLRELKSLFDLVLPGFMPSESKFRQFFVHPIERDQDPEKKLLLSNLIKPFVLRRRKKEVLSELPEKSEDNAYCDLSEQQKHLYKQTLTQDRKMLLEQIKDTNQTIPYLHIFSILSRLKQICNHPALVEGELEHFENYESGKWNLFTELLTEAIESEQKVVVFSQYLKMLDIIEMYAKAKQWGYAQIRGDTMDRRGELKRFQEDKNCVLFIGSLQAAGLGIDLTAASVVIMYDRWWNAARENQAIDRVHRMGQKWPVQVFKMISKGTIEEKIDAMIFQKGKLMEEIVTVDDHAVIKKFTRSDLIELLSYSLDKNSEEPQ
jgi:superfamily II DNA or RNA helicase